jgi:hypothetical protein
MNDMQDGAENGLGCCLFALLDLLIKIFKGK